MAKKGKEKLAVTLPEMAFINERIIIELDSDLPPPFFIQKTLSIFEEDFYFIESFPDKAYDEIIDPNSNEKDQ